MKPILWLPSSLLLAFAVSGHAATNCVGAELYSRSTVKFGRWEVRMKVAATPGSVSSFFTYNNNSYIGSPHPWREIDIEVLGKNTGSFQSNLITGNASNKVTSESLHGLPGLADGFHTFVLDWTPDSIVWRLDGKVRRKTGSDDQQVVDLRDSAQSWRMNLWASSSVDWVGALDLNKLPVAQVVNWMRYSRYTPGAGPDKSNFTFEWLDDFDRLDKTRWSLGDWTFDGNLAQLDPANAITKDGYLALLLTKPGQEGVVGSLPSDPEGNKYPTASLESSSARSRVFRSTAVDGGFRLEGLEGMTEVRSTSGKMLWRGMADAHGQAWIPALHGDVVFVRSGAATGSVVLR
ncbi:MAG TPA: family 16 glycosylhydrolase [Fibrobacteria bacterium]|nr:family 16 glycosylhydrolase [Fibrobacteria bacterium]HOX50613.1 family 16 glycosylhydrolase [Fibrobacteria bacterium]